VTRSVTLAGYAVLLAALLAAEAVGRRWRRSPTLADVLTSVTRPRPGRWLLLAGWLWVGWHLFVRASR
jgi:hypothetical protein